MASVMPRSSGEETFQSRLNVNEPFGQAQLLALVSALADELREAHLAGRFHGAITPADIRYDEAGEVSLGGWGRDTTPNAMRDSPYAPIECYAAVHPQGPWTDVYALAAILWRAIAGGPPAAVLHRKGEVTLERMAPSGFDPAFLRGVDAALAVAPQRRPRDIDSWLAMLANRQENAAVCVPQPSADHRVATSAPMAAPAAARGGRLSRAALAAGIVAAVSGGIYFAIPAEPEDPAPRAPRSQPGREVAAAPQTAVEREVPVAVAPVTEGPVVVAPVLDQPEIVAEASTPPPSLPVTPALEATPGGESPTTVATQIPQQPAADSPQAPVAEVVIDVPVALLRRADDELGKLYAAYDKLNARIERRYRNPKIAYATKQKLYRDGRSIHAALSNLREDRDRLAKSESFAIANRRYDVLAEEITRQRDRIEMLRRSL